MENYHLVIIGLDEIVTNKYFECISEAHLAGQVTSYSIIDLCREKDSIRSRVENLPLQPDGVFLLPDGREESPALILDMLRREKGSVRAYIATEVKAHEAYLRHCVENGIPSLVEKPVVAPMTDGRFDPDRIESVMTELVTAGKSSAASHSVMTLGRYHAIYNDRVIEPLRRRMLELGAPLTSLHLRAAGGVWNLHREYEEREDHPYKYGYGMLMHGAYHYVDIASQLIALNRAIFPSAQLSLTLSAFSAFPCDQSHRIPRRYAAEFDDDLPGWSESGMNRARFGETDVVSSFCVRDTEADKTVMVGTLSFEQTTPSIRHWKEIPEGMYNKNGRTSLVDVEAQLSTLHAVNVRVFDLPVRAGADVDRIDAFARIETRTNASVLPSEDFNATESFGGLFHSDSNRALMREWLAGTEQRSLLADHVLPMRITLALASSLRTPGLPLTIDLF